MSPATEAALASAGVGDVARKWGDSAYDTSAALALWGISQGLRADNVGVATCTGYWDALTGAALCGRNDTVLVLVDDGRYQGLEQVVVPNKGAIARGYVFGGPSAVGAEAYAACENATK